MDAEWLRFWIDKLLTLALALAGALVGTWVIPRHLALWRLPAEAVHRTFHSMAEVENALGVMLLEVERWYRAATRKENNVDPFSWADHLWELAKKVDAPLAELAHQGTADAVLLGSAFGHACDSYVAIVERIRNWLGGGEPDVKYVPSEQRRRLDELREKRAELHRSMEPYVGPTEIDRLAAFIRRVERDAKDTGL